MKNTITFFCLFLCLCLHAQRHDNIWMMGYNGVAPHPWQGGFSFDFSNADMIPKEHTIPISFRKTNAAISDAAGELMFYTNGIHIIDASHQIMENGDSINPVGLTLSFYDFGLNVLQAALALPAPGSDSLYYLIHEPTDHDPGGLNAHVPILFYSLIDMAQNNGLGTVIKKNQVILEDTLDAGKITACKHANGRDWWIFVVEDQVTSTSVYRLLLTPEGISIDGKQDINPGVSFGEGSVGNAVFSPDGTKYIRHDLYFDPWNDIDVYDFDRCTGLLTFKEHFEISDTSFLYGGSAVSPDSRYLYAVTNKYLYQYDLTAAEIEPTKTLVGEYDGHIVAGSPSLFGTPQIGPNGKIYVASAVTDSVMHVINTPNHFGYSSNFTQHSINLPKFNDKSIPNFPNYRLGPLDGSPCDTLGLDNHPLAGFTYFPEELTVTFSDNSYYRPEEWAWDFGDGQNSTERNPVHSYDMAGEYYVCLTVRNEIDEDTYCRWVVVDTMMVVGTGEVLDAGAAFRLFPNPAKDEVTLILTPLDNEGRLIIFDSFGKQVYRTNVSKKISSFSVDIQHLPAGVYFFDLISSEKEFHTQKLIITK